MITITKNPNFSNWFDIRLFGKLKNNALNVAEAMDMAKKLQKEEKSRTEAKESLQVMFEIALSLIFGIIIIFK